MPDRITFDNQSKTVLITVSGAKIWILTDEMSKAITGSLCPYKDKKNWKGKIGNSFLKCNLDGLL